MSLDEFTRLRITSTTSIYEYYPSKLSSYTNSYLDRESHINFISPPLDTYPNANFYNPVGSNSSIVYSDGTNDLGYMSLNILSSGGSACRKSKLYNIYQVSDARETFCNVVMVNRVPDVSETVISRVGLFDINGTYSSTPEFDMTPTIGVYLELSKTSGVYIFKLVEISNDISSTTTTTTVEQSAWNIDILDGNGASRKTLTVAVGSSSNPNSTTSLSLIFSQKWIGRTRIGFMISGILCWVHEFNHTNRSSPWTFSPRQPISYEIIGTTVNSSISMREMSNASNTNSSHILEGRTFTLDSTTTKSLASGQPKDIIFALRAKGGFTTGFLKILNISLFVSGTKGCHFEVQLHSRAESSAPYGGINTPIGAISAAITYTSLIDGFAEYAFYPTSAGSPITITANGYIIKSSVALAETTSSISSDMIDSLQNRSYCSIYDTLYIYGTRVDNGASTNILFLAVSIFGSI